jgi:hypothetical protein
MELNYRTCLSAPVTASSLSRKVALSFLQEGWHQEEVLCPMSACIPEKQGVNKPGVHWEEEGGPGTLLPPAASQLPRMPGRDSQPILPTPIEEV